MSQLETTRASVHPTHVHRRRSPRGQAMVEYTVIAHALLIGGTLLLLPVVSQVLKALTTFYDSIYTVLQSAVL